MKVLKILKLYLTAFLIIDIYERSELGNLSFMSVSLLQNLTFFLMMMQLKMEMFALSHVCLRRSSDHTHDVAVLQNMKVR